MPRKLEDMMNEFPPERRDQIEKEARDIIKMTKVDDRIEIRRLKAFLDVSDFNDSDVIMSHSIRSEDLSIKGTVDLVVGDLRTILAELNRLNDVADIVQANEDLGAKCDKQYSEIHALLYKIEEQTAEIKRLRGVLEEIDRASEPENGLMAWVHGRTQKALKGEA